MTRRFWFATAALLAAFSGWTVVQAADARRATAVTPTPVASHTNSQTISSYCVSCHIARAKTGGLVLEGVSVADLAAHPDVGEKVIRKLRAGMMPPPGMPTPPDAERRAMVVELET